jgi:sugar fermentation stimulation protein A
MNFFTHSIEGIFLDRPNRFIIFADTEQGRIRAHCPNPGRLIELLVPGRKIILEKSANRGRRTGYTLVAVYYGNTIIPLYSARANKVAQHLVLPLLFPGAKAVYPEQMVGTSRFDFLIMTQDESIYLEVKFCTLIENGIGMFPDAPTFRGLRHVKELAALPDASGKPCKGHVLFIIANPECRLFMPNIHTDPEFSLAVQDAKDDIIFHAVSIKTVPEGTTEVANLKVPIDLTPVDLIRKDKGSYVLIIHVKEEKEIPVGSLGPVRFKKGFYCYSGSALHSLHHRIQRHVRKRKKIHWHIDYLTTKADAAKAYPIYSMRRLECSLARELALIADHSIKGFGCSDCGCPSHLFYFKDNPEKNEAFISIVFKFRHFYGII